MIFLPAVLFFALAGGYLVFQSKRWLLNPAPIFVAVNTVAFAGTIPLLDASIWADVVYAWVYVVGLFAFLLGTLIALPPSKRVDRSISNWWSRPLVVDETRWSRLVLASVGIVAAGVTYLYYRAIGYNLLVDSTFAFLRTGTGLEDIIGLRLAAYSGDAAYFAPGYANQFKNTLLPMVVAYFVVRRFVPHGHMKLPTIAALLAAAVAGLLGTGQRGPFLVCAIATVVFAMASLKAKSGRKLAFGIVAVAVGMFLVSTLFLGRTVQRWEGVASVGVLMQEMYERVLVNQQEGAVLGFRYVFERPIEYGAEWAESLLGVLPNHQGSDLAHRVFEARYGTLRGTMPVSVWGSVWHNFGPFGIFIVPLLMGLAYQYVYVRLISGPRALLRLLVFAFATTLLGLWINGSPMQLVNNGIVAILGFHFLVRAGRRRRHWIRKGSRGPSRPDPLEGRAEPNAI